MQWYLGFYLPDDHWGVGGSADFADALGSVAGGDYWGISRLKFLWDWRTMVGGLGVGCAATPVALCGACFRVDYGDRHGAFEGSCAGIWANSGVGDIGVDGGGGICELGYTGGHHGGERVCGGGDLGFECVFDISFARGASG